MNTTQQHLSIADIQNDILLLKDGGGALVLRVSAVNFGLLSDREQVAIISSFAQMLNSLSFSLQIIIVSERLNISSYMTILDKAQKAQSNPLLSEMITQYKQFIQSLVKENEVLDKKFYIIIPLFSLELGLTASKAHLDQKIKTVLLPRKDQIIRQLNRIGLRAIQLTKQELIEVFYNIYSGAERETATQPIDPRDLAVKLKNPQPVKEEERLDQAPKVKPAPIPEPPKSQPTAVSQVSKNHPFVVEELEE